jgi:hypothetical protein
VRIIGFSRKFLGFAVQHSSQGQHNATMKKLPTLPPLAPRSELEEAASKEGFSSSVRAPLPVDAELKVASPEDAKARESASADNQIRTLRAPVESPFEIVGAPRKEVDPLPAPPSDE